MAEAPEEAVGELLENNNEPSDPIQNQPTPEEEKVPISEAEQYGEGGSVNVQGVGNIPLQTEALEEVEVEEPELTQVAPPSPARLVDEVPSLKEQLLNTFIKIAEHPTKGEYWADRLINNIQNEEFDFGDGGKYEGIKVTDLLPHLEDIYPDIQEVGGKTNGEIRLVSPTAERLKKYLRDVKNREESPWFYGAKDALDVTTTATKELLVDAPQKLGLNLIKTGMSLAEWGIGGIPKAYWRMEGLSEKAAEKKTKELFDISGYFYEPKKPQTVLGQLALSGGEAGLAYLTGRGIYNAVAGPIKSLLPRVAEMLATPAGKIAISEVIGGTLITSREERLAPLLQMLGVTGEGPFGRWIDYIAGSEDDGVFEDRFKSFVDSVYTGVGLSLAAPLVMLAGKGAWHASKGTAKAGEQALSAASSFGERIFHNYPVEEAMRMDLGGPKVVQTEELKRLKSKFEEGLLKLDAGERISSPVKKVLEKTLNLRESEKRSVKKLLEDQGYTITDDAITPVINVTPVKSFLQPTKNIDEVITDTLTGIDITDTTQTFFNINTINGRNLKEAIDEGAKIFQEGWEKGIKTHGETWADSDKLLADLEFMIGEENIPQYLSDISKMSDLLPGHMLAIKRLVTEQAIPFRQSSQAVADAAEKVATGELSGNSKEWKSLLAQFYLDGINFMDILETDVRLKGNVARSLNVLKKRLGEGDEMMEAIINGAKDGSLQGEELLVNIAQTVSKMTDTTQLLHGAKPKGKLYHTFEGIKSWAVSGLLSGVKTLAAAPLGISMYMAVKSGETWVAAGMNAAGRRLYKKTGIGVLGTGKGITFDQAKAYHFGMMQALLEVFGGTGYYQRSAFGKGGKAFRTLDAGNHEISKMIQAEKESLNLSVLGEFTLAKGVTGKAFEDMFNLKEYGIEGKGPDFFKFLVNSAGFVQGINGRIIMAEDGFFRTIIERAEMHKLSMRRAEERLLGRTENSYNVPLPDGSKFTNEELANEYFHVVKNYPKELAEKGKDEATIAVMQEKKRGGVVNLIEDYKNTTSNHPNALKNIASNLGRTYAASKFSFIRTMANIYKQTLSERGIGKLGKILFNDEQAKKFASDEVFRQESIAQVGSGLLTMGIGAGLGANLFKYENKEIFMDGVDASNRGNRTVKLAQGGAFGPLIKVRDLETNTITTYSLERMDMVKASAVLGAIGSSYVQQGLEAFEKMQGNRSLEGRRELLDLQIKLARALGDFATDLPMAQGLNDILNNLVIGFGPVWNPGKEISTFFNGFFNPINSVGSSLRASTKNLREDVRFSKVADQKNRMVDMGEDWENKVYTNKYGEEEYVDVKFKGEKVNFVIDILNQMQDISERVSIVDMRDQFNPILGQDSYALVSPEANYIRHLPDPTKDKFKRAISILALPMVGNLQAKENTIELMNFFEFDYGDREDWHTESNYNLSPEQLYTWAVEAGRLNKETFGSEYWKDILFEIDQGMFDSDSAEGVAYKAEIFEELKMDIEENREEALEMMLNLERNFDAWEYIDQARARGNDAYHIEDNL